MAATFYLLPPLNTIPVESLEASKGWIGRIVKCYNDPTSNYTPRETAAGANVNVDAGFRNVEEIISNTRSNSARLLLADIFSVNRTRSETESPHFKASEVVQRIKLRQEDEYLAHAMKSDEVKAKLKRWHKLRSPVFLIVGLLVADHVHYAEVKGNEREFGIEGKPPSGLISTAAGSPLPLPDLIGASVSKTIAEQRGLELTATGRRIIAIEYRVLTKRLLSTSGQVDMRPGGIRGDRSFGQTEEAMNEAFDEQQSEVLLDPDPLPDIVDEEDAEEYCFSLDE